MKKIRTSIFLAVVIAMLITSLSFAQYSGLNWGSAYQLVNMGTGNAQITITYYTSTCALAKTPRTYTDVVPGSSRKVILARDDTDLSGGNYSIMISSDQPIGSIANIQLYPPASTNPQPPFASYSGAASGGTTVYVPNAMYNYYNYYTEMFIQNAGTAAATNITINYYPTTVNGTVMGAQLLNDPVVGGTSGVASLALGASMTVSQQAKTALGGTPGRFLGLAVITSDQPIVVAVNEQYPTGYKLMEFNSFTSTEVSTSVSVPIHMKGYYGYYDSLTIANTNMTTPACVQLVYTPSGTLNTVITGTVSPVTVKFAIPAHSMLNRYDGPTPGAAQTDLQGAAANYSRFFGSVQVTSIQDVGLGCTTGTSSGIVVVQNVESTAAPDDQAGSFNGIPISAATTTIINPELYSDFYGYYSSTTVQNTTATAGSCTWTYTSDGVESSVKNTTKAYTHAIPANGIINIYEGSKGGAAARGDINTDALWQAGGFGRFNGSVTIACTQPVVGFADLEVDINAKDSMYTYNLFNQ